MSSAISVEQQIKQWAQELGFLACGFAKAEALTEESHTLTSWLDNNFHGNMQYMENHRDMRLDPTHLVPGAKTVISLAFNYYPFDKNEENSPPLPADSPKTRTTQNEINEKPLIAKYAWGDDYHRVIKDKLFVLMDSIKSLEPEFEGRAFVDSAPVMERQWAVRAGLGWIGKNSLLLRKGVGSFFFLAEIIGNLELQPDAPQTDHCGECTACIDACPTNAIVQPQVIDSRRCISYLTIEDKSWPNRSASVNTPEQPVSAAADLLVTVEDSTKTRTTSESSPVLNTGAWAYGCDVCQDVCPWNRFSTPHNEPQFAPREMMGWSHREWEEALREPARIKPLLKNSPMQRAGLPKLLDQIKLSLHHQKGNSPDSTD
jgi:epoxyqueuosine reductase